MSQLLTQMTDSEIAAHTATKVSPFVMAGTGMVIAVRKQHHPMPHMDLVTPVHVTCAWVKPYCTADGVKPVTMVSLVTDLPHQRQIDCVLADAHQPLTDHDPDELVMSGLEFMNYLIECSRARANQIREDFKRTKL